MSHIGIGTKPPRRITERPDFSRRINSSGHISAEEASSKSRGYKFDYGPTMNHIYGRVSSKSQIGEESYKFDSYVAYDNAQRETIVNTLEKDNFITKELWREEFPPALLISWGETKESETYKPGFLKRLFTKKERE